MKQYNDLARKKFHDEDYTSLKRDLKRNENEMFAKAKWKETLKSQGFLTKKQQTARAQEIFIAGRSNLPKQEKYDAR